MEWVRWLKAVEGTIVRAGGRLTGPVEYDDDGARFPFEFVVGHVDRIASKQAPPYVVLRYNSKSVATLGWPPDSNGDYALERVANFFIAVAAQYTEAWRPGYLKLRDEVRAIVGRALPQALFIELGFECEWRDAVAWQTESRTVTMGLNQTYDGPNVRCYVMIESAGSCHFQDFTTKPQVIADLIVGHLLESA